MGARVRSSRMPRAAVARLAPPRDQTTRAFASVATPASVDDACRGMGSVRPPFPAMLARDQDALDRSALHLTGNRGAAAAVYQETVRAADDALDRRKGGANQRAWLYRIATNAFLRHRRRRSKEGSLGEGSADAVPAATAGWLEAPNLLAEVAAFVANLSVRQCLALIQRMFHELSYTEIAARLQCAEVTARVSAKRSTHCEAISRAVVNAEALVALTEPLALGQGARA
jgi:RNA polymerase sigma factor (sigma-70 family)